MSEQIPTEASRTIMWCMSAHPYTRYLFQVNILFLNISNCIQFKQLLLFRTVIAFVQAPQIFCSALVFECFQHSSSLFYFPELYSLPIHVSSPLVPKKVEHNWLNMLTCLFTSWLYYLKFIHSLELYSYSMFACRCFFFQCIWCKRSLSIVPHEGYE